MDGQARRRVPARDVGATTATRRSGGSGRCVQELGRPACGRIDDGRVGRARRRHRCDGGRSRRDGGCVEGQGEGQCRERAVIAAVSDPRRRTVRRRVVGRCRRCVGFGVMGVMRLTRVTRVIHLRRVICVICVIRLIRLLCVIRVMSRRGVMRVLRDRHERPRPELRHVDAVDIAHLGRRAALQPGGGAGQHRHRALHQQRGDEQPGGQVGGGPMSLHGAIVAAVGPARSVR